jgi:hypothetical protein
MVEEGTVNEADALARKHPIAAFGLDALTAGAAKLRPDRKALAEAGPGSSGRELSYGAFDREICACAHQFSELGLAPGQRVLILTGARTACVVTALAALAAGLEPLLVPIGVESVRLGEIAASAGCVAIAGPTSYGEFDLEGSLFEAAAGSETIRFVGTLGPGQADGAIDLAPERLQFSDAKRDQAASDIRPRIGTLDQRKQPVFHEQSAVLAAALEFVGKAEIAAGAKLLSTLSPASFASLVAGPVASLLSGAPLTLFGPFESTGLLALLDGDGPSHCVVPATILPEMAQAGLLHQSVLAGAIAITRDRTTIASHCDCPLVEVHARAEGTLRIERRAREQSPSAPILAGEVLAPVLPAQRSWR